MAHEEEGGDDGRPSSNATRDSGDSSWSLPGSGGSGGSGWPTSSVTSFTSGGETGSGQTTDGGESHTSASDQTTAATVGTGDATDDTGGSAEGADDSGEGCSAHRDCARDQVCIDGVCIDVSEECPCPPETYCDLSDNHCEQGCLLDEHCSRGRICDSDRRECLDGCRTDANCPSGEICEQDMCLAGCRDDSQCPGEQICVDRTCRQGCRDHGDCPIAQVCDPSTRLCVAGCVDDGGCGESDHCLDGSCRPRAEVLFTIESATNMRWLKVDTGHVLWFDDDGTDEYHLYRLARDGGSPERIARLGDASDSYFTLFTKGHLYAARRDHLAGTNSSTYTWSRLDPPHTQDGFHTFKTIERQSDQERSAVGRRACSRSASVVMAHTEDWAYFFMNDCKLMGVRHSSFDAFTASEFAYPGTLNGTKLGLFWTAFRVEEDTMYHYGSGGLEKVFEHRENLSPDYTSDDNYVYWRETHGSLIRAKPDGREVQVVSSDLKDAYRLHYYEGVIYFNRDGRAYGIDLANAKIRAVPIPTTIYTKEQLVDGYAWWLNHETREIGRYRLPESSLKVRASFAEGARP